MLIALPTCVEFAEVYLACLFAGLIAVPVPVPGGSSSATERVAAAAADCTPEVAITTSAACGDLAERLPGTVVEAVGDAGDGDADLHEVAGRDTVAVLQYSSGSTGTPKGVMLTHGNLLGNIVGFQRGSGIGPDDVFGGWIPLHHDMGLFSQLTAALVLGAPNTLMPPADFVRRPIEWFRLLDRFGITVTAGPNFAYDLCLRLISDDMLAGIDLSRLRLAINGSEPIHAPTMAVFAQRFAGTGLRPDVVSPGYGLAESTVYVSCSRIGAQPTVLTVDPAAVESSDAPRIRAASEDGKQIVGVGRPAAHEVRIVDPQRLSPVPEGGIGEIWVRGDSVGVGYWNRADLTAEIFRARLAGSDLDWLRTGDLGALVDGELFVTGRLKEVLIVHGRNVFPQDVERQARAAHEALVGFTGAAFEVPAPDSRIVLVHEVSPTLLADDLPGVVAAVTRSLTVEFGAPIRNVMLVRRGTVRRTTSGKIQRVVMRDRFLAGEITPVYADLDPAVSALAGRAHA
ncbi:fatty acyl-AMP ligase [Kutzneria sp. 744]|uniref:fatty acyl-AMP ligase n=1 Tax=Kutzneria sp. (strain 744) TaxID=345341 RepID=UPI0003EEC8AF|nr:non-ribosomal peptide synthetase [Kutzneria sp. 744]